MNYLFIFILITNLLAGPIKEKTEQYIFSIFSENVIIKMNTFHLNKNITGEIQNTAKQAFYRDKIYYWDISQNDTTIAYAFLDNVMGKSMPITFIVILNRDGSILSTNVIKYREAYGGEVGNLSWLSQFNKFNSNSSYKVGKELDGITGATISVNSLTKGIQKIVLLFPLIKDRL